MAVDSRQVDAVEPVRLPMGVSAGLFDRQPLADSERAIKAVGAEDIARQARRAAQDVGVAGITARAPYWRLELIGKDLWHVIDAGVQDGVDGGFGLEDIDHACNHAGGILHHGRAGLDNDVHIKVTAQPGNGLTECRGFENFIESVAAAQVEPSYLLQKGGNLSLNQFHRLDQSVERTVATGGMNVNTRNAGEFTWVALISGKQLIYWNAELGIFTGGVVSGVLDDGETGVDPDALLDAGRKGRRNALHLAQRIERHVIAGLVDDAALRVRERRAGHADNAAGANNIAGQLSLKGRAAGKPGHHWRDSIQDGDDAGCLDGEIQGGGVGVGKSAQRPYPAIQDIQVPNQRRGINLVVDFGVGVASVVFGACHGCTHLALSYPKRSVDKRTNRDNAAATIKRHGRR